MGPCSSSLYYSRVNYTIQATYTILSFLADTFFGRLTALFITLQKDLKTSNIPSGRKKFSNCLHLKLTYIDFLERFPLSSSVGYLPNSHPTPFLLQRALFYSVSLASLLGRPWQSKPERYPGGLLGKWSRLLTKKEAQKRWFLSHHTLLFLSLSFNCCKIYIIKD